MFHACVKGADPTLFVHLSQGGGDVDRHFTDVVCLQVHLGRGRDLPIESEVCGVPG